MALRQPTRKLPHTKLLVCLGVICGSGMLTNRLACAPPPPKYPGFDPAEFVNDSPKPVEIVAVPHFKELFDGQSERVFALPAKSRITLPFAFQEGETTKFYVRLKGEKQQAYIDLPYEYAYHADMYHKVTIKLAPIIARLRPPKAKHSTHLTARTLKIGSKEAQGAK